jgi:hypothetical protein
VALCYNEKSLLHLTADDFFANEEIGQHAALMIARKTSERTPINLVLGLL